MAVGHVTKALYVRLDAKPGKEAEVEAFLNAGLPIVEEEPGTIAWFALRIDASTYAIFDVFPDDSARETHLAGRVGAALMEKAPELLAEPPSIGRIDVLASKLPA